MVNIYRPQYAATKKYPAFDACMTMNDFVCMVQYVLENTALEGKDDPRAILLKYAQSGTIRKVPREGWRVVSKKKLAQKR